MTTPVTRHDGSPAPRGHTGDSPAPIPSRVITYRTPDRCFTRPNRSAHSGPTSPPRGRARAWTRMPGTMSAPPLPPRRPRASPAPTTPTQGQTAQAHASMRARGTTHPVPAPEHRLPVPGERGRTRPARRRALMPAPGTTPPGTAPSARPRARRERGRTRAGSPPARMPRQATT